MPGLTPIRRLAANCAAEHLLLTMGANLWPALVETGMVHGPIANPLHVGTRPACEACGHSLVSDPDFCPACLGEMSSHHHDRA